MQGEGVAPQHAFKERHSKGLQGLANWHIRGRVGNLRAKPIRDAAYHRLEQRGLVGKISVKRFFRGAGTQRHSLHLRPLIAMSQEHVSGCLNHRRTPYIAAPMR